MNKLAQPTAEQLKKFWGWCGFKETFASGNRWVDDPDGNFYSFGTYPPLTLNSLFQYPVLKLKGEYAVTLRNYVDREFYEAEVIGGTLARGEYKAKNDDPILALFWAIWPVIEVHSD